MDFSKGSKSKMNKVERPKESTPPVVRQTNKTVPDKMDHDLPPEVQEEIDDLCYFVPEVENHFRITDKIGEGTFSSVFLARLKNHPDVKDLFALKHIIPTSHPNRILGELTCLQMIGGKENVMGVELCLRNKDHIVIVMKYFPHDKFQDYFNILELSEVKEYMRNLLVALKHVHDLDIIHRDIKPSNFLHNTKTKQYTLVDFGLAHDAPVKLNAANQEKSPVVKEIQPWVAAKEGKGSACKTDSESKLPAKVSNPPLSQPVSRMSPRKPDPGPSTSTVPGETKPSQILVPSLLFSKGRSLRGQQGGGDMAELSATKRSASISPRRKALQRSMMNNDAGSKNKGEKTGETSQSSWSIHRSNARTCECYGRPMICSICYARSVQSAQRAGTPGFRSPEVLMKHPHQTTAVDMWSAGVIFLSLLSGRYPFFRGNDDLTCLSQIMSVLGTDRVQQAAKSIDKLVTCRPVVKPLDLKSLCLRLRSSTTGEKGVQNPTKQWSDIPHSAIDLLHLLVDPNPNTRITAEKALQHSFFTEK